MFFIMKINQISNVKKYLKMLADNLLNNINMNKKMHVRSRFFYLLVYLYIITIRLMICSNNNCTSNIKDDPSGFCIYDSKYSIKFHSNLMLCTKCKLAFCKVCFNIHQRENCLTENKREIVLDSDSNENDVSNSKNLKDCSSSNNNSPSFFSNITGCFVCGIEGFSCSFVIIFFFFNLN
jgi:hypothetical protein